MAVSVGDDSQYLKQVERHSCEDMSLVGCGNYIAFDIPSFYDESLNTSSMSASSNGTVIDKPSDTSGPAAASWV